MLKCKGGKALVNLSEIPQLRELFKVTIFKKPSSVKCSPFFIFSKHCLNNKKSETLAVTHLPDAQMQGSGYLSK